MFQFVFVSCNMQHNGKKNVAQKNDSYLLTYDCRCLKGGVEVGGDHLRVGVGVGCMWLLKI
jgi:hypothetical protein